MLAFREGQWLAHRASLGLQALHVSDERGPWEPDDAAVDWLRRAALDPTLVLLRYGSPWVEIVRHALEVSTAVIVLGSHGASGPQAMTLGSTASRVALRAPCPTLLVARERERLPSNGIATPSLHSLQEHR